MHSRNVTDQMGRVVIVPSKPLRIVSLVPSQTELLFDLDVGSRLVGITRFCIHPKSLSGQTTSVGGTKAVDLDVLESLQPDLVIGNKEENQRSQIEEIAARWPVWMSDISNLSQSLEMIALVGDLVGRSDSASLIVREIENSFSTLIPGPKKTVLYFIWRKPFMLAGTGTFIDDLLSRAGLVNISPASRYPVITANEISELDPDLIYLSSEPYPFKEKHLEELGALSPRSELVLVDGELFSWYGSRLRQSAAYLGGLMSGPIKF